VLLDQGHRFHAVLSLTDDVDFGKPLQQKRQLIPRGFFVIYNDCVYGHNQDPDAEYRRTQHPLAIPSGEEFRLCSFHSLGYHVGDFERGQMTAKKSARARILSSKIVYKGPVFGVRRDEVLEPGGVRTTREVVTHPGSVVVLPVLPDGRILLVRQYRHATRQYLWELVAGRIEPDETPRQAAARELIEETGYRAKRLRVFLDVFPTPGFLEERMYILLAQELTSGDARPEEDEKITVSAFAGAKLMQMIRRGKLRDAKSIAGLLYYFSFLSPLSASRRPPS
jgi:ADP-ribose pyrophosphatase